MPGRLWSARRRELQALPRRAATLVRAVGLLLAAVVLLSLTTLAWYERDETLDTATDRVELLAQVLEDHVTRSVETAALSLRGLAEQLAQQAVLDPARLQLEQAPLGLPYLRGVALLDLHGHVLASANPAERGLRLDLRALGAMPAVGQDRLAPLLPGRGLADLVAGGRTPRAAAVSMLPLWRRVEGPGGQDLLLLALINPDALANYQQIALSNSGTAAVLLSYEGQVLAASEQLPLNPGARLIQHPVLQQWLPRHEHGSYIGTGLLPEAQVVAFRVSRTRPLVLLVEQPRAQALQQWYASRGRLAVVGLCALVLIAGGVLVVLRSLRAREVAREALDDAHAQVALRERELSVLLKSLQELVFRADADGRLSFVNARFAALSLGRAEQALGRRLPDLVEPGDRERVQALFDRETGRAARHAEASVRIGDGSLHRFDIAVVPLYGQGQVVGFAGSAVDVTERYVAQQRLQQQLEFTAQLLDLSPQPVAVFDARGCYVTINRAWEAFTGLVRAEVIGRRAGQLLPKGEYERHAAVNARLLIEGGRMSEEVRLRRCDGQLRDMLLTKVRVDELGGMRGILCSLTDVSEFRAAERATREARDAAEEASRAKSEFIANISHELRTPLQSILGFSELGMVRGREAPKLAAMFGDIHASGQRMLALVNDLLDVSKIESSVGTFDLERCDLRQPIQVVLRELEPLMARRGLRLALRLPESPLPAKVDPLRFQQVVRNVLANAIKFSPEGATLELEAGFAGEGEIRIGVADRGPGIPAGEIDKIFEAFVQSSQTKDGSGGTGLGLAICRKIIEIHGGRIYARNREGGGTVFYIELPSRSSGDTQLLTQF